jgi:hypothetical protein
MTNFVWIIMGGISAILALVFFRYYTLTSNKREKLLSSDEAINH